MMAESSSTKSNKICEITSCSICLETFQNPKVLPCIHTFCLDCLQSYCDSKTKEQEVSCPLCRTIFKIPSGGIKNLPNNFFIQQLLNVNKSSAFAGAQESDKPTLCELCSDSEMEVAATSYCIECDQRICDRCSGTHRKAKSSRSHQVVHGDEIPSSLERAKSAVSYCDKHPCEQNRLFCYDCNSIICPKCLSKHVMHKCSDVQEAADDSRVQLKEDIDGLSACVSQQREQLEQLDAGTERFLTKIASTRSEMSQKYDEIISLIQSHKSQLMEELNQFKDNVLKKMETRKDEIERQFVITEGFRRYCEEIMNKGAACDISRTAHDLHVRAEELVKTQDEPECRELGEVEITFKPSVSITDHIKNFIGELVFRDTLMEDQIEDQISLMAFLTKPKLLHVMPCIDTTQVSGMTVLGGKVFVVRLTSLVYVYNSGDFSFVRTLTMTGSQELRGLVSCSQYNCLYACDYDRDCYYRYDLSSNVTTNWSAGRYCCRFSVANCYNLLLCGTKGIQECTPHGIFIKEIRLDNSLDSMEYCVQLSNSNLAICDSGDAQHPVCVVDKSGRIIHSYGGSPGSGVGQLNNPYHVIADVLDNLLVADSNNNKVQLLSPTLSYLGDIVVPGHQLKDPYTLYFDALNRRLYIGEWAGGRVFVLGV